MNTYPQYGKISGTVFMVGLGSIGRGTLPLIERHFDYDRIVVLDPQADKLEGLKERGIETICDKLTPENYRQYLQDILGEGGFCVNLSVDVSSLDMMKACREMGVRYIDTVTEPWEGFYFDTEDNAARTNYALRQKVRDEKAANPGGTTAVSCCGANPGMVSWFVKEALLILARDTGRETAKLESREDWAKLMQSLGVKGVHIAERDTQVSTVPKAMGEFVNTWSVEGFIAEGFQPAELGWGTHEKWIPDNAHKFDEGCQAAIWLEQPGANTRVHTWCPTPGAQYGLLVTHNEAVSIADYYTIGEGNDPEFRPTCHYAYHPANMAMLSLDEMFGSGQVQEKQRILEVDEISEGIDELGVLLFGHEKNALWYGSRLSNEETKSLAPDQNATGLQVTSAVLAGMVWALENPEAGIVETDEMDHARCLEVQKPYLGSVEAHYTDWTPLHNRSPLFPLDLDESDPWQFRNILVR